MKAAIMLLSYFERSKNRVLRAETTIVQTVIRGFRDASGLPLAYERGMQNLYQQILLSGRLHCVHSLLR